MLTYGRAQGAARAAGAGRARRLSSGGAQDLAARERPRRRAGTQFTCFTGTKVQILTLLEPQAQAASRERQCLEVEALLIRRERQVLSLLALPVQKYKY